MIACSTEAASCPSGHRREARTRPADLCDEWRGRIDFDDCPWSGFRMCERPSRREDRDEDVGPFDCLYCADTGRRLEGDVEVPCGFCFGGDDFELDARLSILHELDRDPAYGGEGRRRR